MALAISCAQVIAAQPATAPLSQAQATSGWSEEGLQPLKVKGLDLVYARPDADLGAYAKILLGAVTVAFRRDWERNGAPGSRRPVSAADAQRIRDKLAKLVRAEVVQELEGGGYQLVDAAGDNVLEVDLAIVNLQVNAPDIGVGRTTSYAVSAGEMTLVAELRDSGTGEVVSGCSIGRWRGVVPSATHYQCRQRRRGARGRAWLGQGAAYRLDRAKPRRPEIVVRAGQLQPKLRFAGWS